MSGQYGTIHYLVGANQQCSQIHWPKSSGLVHDLIKSHENDVTRLHINIVRQLKQIVNLGLCVDSCTIKTESTRKNQVCVA